METAVHLACQNLHQNLTDAQMWAEELRLAAQVEDLGFDAIWAVEHHFDDYCMVPDNMQLMAYLAARTSTLKLGLGAVILPWHNPLRVVENLTQLDLTSGGRVLLGFGRGLAKMEYEGFGLDMGESRERWDEAAPMVLAGLETGIVEGAGPFYPQPRVEIRPRPAYTWKDRLFSVAMSPDSELAAGDIGARMMGFVQGPLEHHAVGIENWRSRYRSVWGTEPGAPVLTDFTYCHEDADEARRMAEEYVAKYFLSVVRHYEFMGDHFATTKGYTSYAENMALLQAAGLEAGTQVFVDAQVWGTPDQILARYQERLDVLGSLSADLIFSFGGMAYDTVEASMKLFAREVLPSLRKMEARTPASD